MHMELPAPHLLPTCSLASVTLYADSSLKPEDTLLRSFYQSTDNVDLYKNTYALPLGFLVSDSLEADWDLTADDPGIN